MTGWKTKPLKQNTTAPEHFVFSGVSFLSKDLGLNRCPQSILGALVDNILT